MGTRKPPLEPGDIDRGDQAPCQGQSDAEKSVDSPDQTQLIEEILDQWEATFEAGEPVDIETLCSQQPELVPQIKRRIAALQEVDRKLAKRKPSRRATIPTMFFDTNIEHLRFVNAGGLGEVYVGEDDDLRRKVAVKLMHEHLCGDEERKSQFELEAEITGRLEHPGIVPLYGVGRTKDDRPFYAMRFIEGRTLGDAIKDHFRNVEAQEQGDEGISSSHNPEFEFRRLLANFVSICKTIAYTHNRGVVHRDIKPANVMIGRFGEAVVVDWGLAVPVLRDERFRRSGEESIVIPAYESGSKSGRGIGTPAFMSPQQFANEEPSPADDIYALGATLYVLLSGKPPIRSKTLSVIRDDTLAGRVPELDGVRKGISRQLQSIVYRAMAKEPSDRYATASDLAKDVERYLADEPVSAHRDSIGLKLARAARRHRVAAQTTFVGVLACMLIAGIAAVTISAQRSAAERLRSTNLASSSQFMARSIGQDIDRIWRVLEFEASAPQVIDLVTQSNQRIAENQPPSLESESELQAWLDQRMKRYGGLNTVNALFALSKNGTQIARAPLPEEPQVGTSFHFRDYYTGLGYDLPKNSQRLLLEPLTGPAVRETDVHMSVVYESTLQDESVLKVTFTVPIWDQDHNERIGVLGTSVAIGDIFNSHLDGAAPEWLAGLKENAWLVDLRDDYLNEKRQRGVLLQHPRTIQQDLSVQIPRLTIPQLDLIDRTLRREQQIGIEESVLDFVDPIDQSHVRASIVPIQIDGRGKKPIDLHWVIVATEPQSD